MTKPGGNRGIINACIILIIACLLAINGVHCKRHKKAPRGVLVAGEAVFDVTKFGAKPNGKKDNALALIRAWRAACEFRGRAKVLVPPGRYVAGEVLFVGPCAAKPVTVEIQGELLAYDDMSAYTNGAWIMVEKCSDVVLTGGGTINGRGSNSWKYAGKGAPPLPVSLVFQTVQNSQINNLNFVDSMGFHVKVTDSANIGLWKLRITAPDESPNTDGIHTSSTIGINITDSTIGTGDDCISVGHGTQNMLIARIFCGPGHGISIGSLGKRPDETNLKDITVINCTMTGTENGARIKTYHESPMIQASGIYFQDIVMNHVKNPIVIDQHYNSKNRPQQSKVKISDVHFRNIHGTTTSRVPIALHCSSSFPCQGIELADINLFPVGFVGPLGSACSNANYYIKGRLSPSAPRCA